MLELYIMQEPEIETKIGQDRGLRDAQERNGGLSEANEVVGFVGKWREVDGFRV